MLTPVALAVLSVTVVATSFLSGIFGMAGGLVLLGALLVVLDVVPAMVLFAVTQMAANGWRSVLWRRHVVWGIVWRYLIGALAMFFIMRWLAFLPDKALIYLALGIAPFVADALPRKLVPDITRPGAPYICGFLLIFFQLLAGGAGHILDIFFQKSNLDRRAVVATKAVTQMSGHVMRFAYFGSFLSALDTSVPVWVYAAFMALAVVGTTLAAGVLQRMSDASFRAWSQWLIRIIGATFLARGLWLVLVAG
jgi:uncharacterized membrane protein YfcA